LGGEWVGPGIGVLDKVHINQEEGRFNWDGVFSSIGLNVNKDEYKWRF